MVRWSRPAQRIGVGRVTRPLRYALTITDGLFLLYWTLAVLSELSLLQVSPELMYADYRDPRVVAWNWSFFPLDLVFSITGLAAVRASARGNAIWKPLALVSLTLTMTAGGMAISYWIILGEYDPFWFVPNLVLVLWPLVFIPELKGWSSEQPLSVGSQHPVNRNSSAGS